MLKNFRKLRPRMDLEPGFFLDFGFLGDAPMRAADAHPPCYPATAPLFPLERILHDNAAQYVASRDRWRSTLAHYDLVGVHATGNAAAVSEDFCMTAFRRQVPPAAEAVVGLQVIPMTRRASDLDSVVYVCGTALVPKASAVSSEHIPL